MILLSNTNSEVHVADTTKLDLGISPNQQELTCTPLEIQHRYPKMMLWNRYISPFKIWHHFRVSMSSRYPTVTPWYLDRWNL